MPGFFTRLLAALRMVFFPTPYEAGLSLGGFRPPTAAELAKQEEQMKEHARLHLEMRVAEMIFVYQVREWTFGLRPSGQARGPLVTTDDASVLALADFARRAARLYAGSATFEHLRHQPLGLGGPP